MMMPQTRPMVDSDRKAALAALGDPRAIDQPRQKVLTDGEAFITVDLARTTPHIGAIAGNVRGLSALYALALAACELALDAGFTVGTFTIHDRALLRRIQRTFNVVTTITALSDGVPACWEITVNLADARQQVLAWSQLQ